jgi:UDP-glucose 4-epimerase
MKTWVIGRGGLLGRSVEQRLASLTQVFVPNQKFDWSDSSRAKSQLATECQSFISSVADDNWTIYWCAGRGTLNSTPDQMHEENVVFESFLQALESNLSVSAKQKGTIFFASSAGAVYGGSKNPPFTELTQPIPMTSYGDAKIHQEALLRDFATKHGIRVLVGRISNVYGARQDLAKNQGLISTICFSVLRRQPLNLFVPLETSRNYIYVEDAAKCIVAHAQKIAMTAKNSSFAVKLVVAQENLTIGGILNIAKSVLRTRPLVTVSTNKHGSSQPQSLIFKSVVDTELDNKSTTGFSVGMKKVMTDLQSSFLASGWQRSN